MTILTQAAILALRRDGTLAAVVSIFKIMPPSCQNHGHKRHDCNMALGQDLIARRPDGNEHFQ